MAKKKATTAAKPQESLVQRLVRCTTFSKVRAETFIKKASEQEVKKIENCPDNLLAKTVHELVTAREKKKQD